jgi:BirA family biotin operon repressor/biotin-[acetyl-CoA-carboxylase] ligase
VHRATTTSTNDLARHLAQSGAPDGTVVVAEEQTAGRGRQGRVWVAPPGRALTLSAVVRWEPGRGDDPATPDEGPGPAAPRFELLPLVAAVAVAEACERAEVGDGRAVSVPCAIKWPNDVWIDGRKVAGILIEARPQEGWAVLGVGVNIGTEAGDLPPDLRETATSLRIASGGAVDRDDALGELLERLAARLGDWRGGDVEALLDRYRERDALSGDRIGWESAGGDRMMGRAQGIDGRGNLVVLTDAGDRVALEAGEVHLLRS